MRRGIVLALAAAAIAYLYALALIFAIGVATALPTPSWGLGVLSNRAHSMLVWMHLIQVAAIVLVSLPFAYVITVTYRRFGVWLALGTTIVICGAIEIPVLIEFFGSVSLFLGASLILNAVELVLVLPTLVSMMRRLPSNYRLERP